jgi:putative effector of murein hydrolase LrgA (UPF0299 family)
MRKMLEYLTLIFGCQLAGELVVTATGLPVPGPVCGMALLFAGLLVKGRLPAELARVADALLGNLSLLFVPAGVGVMLRAGLIAREWLPIAAARGLAIGTAGHGIGTARALQVNEPAGAFAGLAMGLNALATAVLLPLLWHRFF